MDSRLAISFLLLGAFCTGESRPRAEVNPQMKSMMSPNPATLACIGIGLAALGLFRRRASSDQ